jgi:RNA polymerase sigma-70 factor (ECF subfamily)
LKLYEDHKPRRETHKTNDQPAEKNGGASTSGPEATEKSAHTGRAIDDKDHEPETGTQPSKKQPTAGPAQPAAAAPGDQWPPVKLFRPMKPNSVRGIVADEKHAPIVGAKISLFRINTSSRDRALIKSTTAGDNGFFSIENVMDLNKEFPGGKLPPQGDFGGDFLQVFIQSPGRATYSWLQARQHVARWGDVQVVTLIPAAPLRGRILGADDKPVAGAVVSVAQSGPSLGFGWNGALSARTDAEGNYAINDLGPFDLQKYRDQQEAARKSNRPQTIESATKASPYLTPPKLTVEHPDFAVKQTAIEKIPGTTDAKLEPAAILNGSVIYAGSGKPAAGVIVRAGGNRKMFSSSDEITKSGSFVQVNYRYPFYDATVRTGADGRYKIGSLPAGFYRLWVEMPDWVSDEVGDLQVKPGATHETFAVELTKGGTLSVRLVDSKTGKPIEVKPGTSAIIGAQPAGGSNRPLSQQTIKANADGRFELQAPPGRRVVYVATVYEGDERKWTGDTGNDNSRQLVTITDGKTTNVDAPVTDPKNMAISGVFQAAPADEPPLRTESKPASDQPAPKKGAESTPKPKSATTGAQTKPPAEPSTEASSRTPVKFQLVQNVEPVAEKTSVKRPPGILAYGDDTPDGKKSFGGSGEMIRFELPEGVTKIKGIRIHGSRYGLPQAPKEDFEITFLNEKRDETLHVEAAPYRLFNRGKEQWVRVAFKNEIELPRKFWVCLNFNAAQTKGVYVSYDTSTKGEYSRVGLPGLKEEPKETDFKGDWMVQLLLAKPEK